MLFACYKVDTMNTQILKLNKAGQPVAWIDYEAAATAVSKGNVVWAMGDVETVLRGGFQRATGKRSVIA